MVLRQCLNVNSCLHGVVAGAKRKSNISGMIVECYLGLRSADVGTE